MKGIAHFAAGVAAASFFPDAVRAGAEGNPLYFILGGVFGLLPDTIDFRFQRFLCRYDVEIQPDPLHPDPEAIAAAVAQAVHRAYETGRAVTIKLHTVRTAADRWRRYRVTFDVGGRRVTAAYGPEVTTGRQPIAGTAPEEPLEASAPLACGLKVDYEAETTVDIFDGPVFRLTPLADGRVMPAFIPWHREWSHSIPVALVLALLGAAAWGPLAGLVIGAGLGAHIALDQLGHMGSNLFFPFQRRRTPGLRFAHSGDPLPNLTAVWASCLAVIWNLGQAVPAFAHGVNLITYLVYGGVVPLALFRLAFGRNKADVDASH